MIEDNLIKRMYDGVIGIPINCLTEEKNIEFIEKYKEIENKNSKEKNEYYLYIDEDCKKISILSIYEMKEKYNKEEYKNNITNLYMDYSFDNFCLYEEIMLLKYFKKEKSEIMDYLKDKYKKNK